MNRPQWRASFLAAAVALGGSVTPSPAFLGGDEYDIAAFCREPAARRTVVYVDDRAMEDGNVAWANRLYQKLSASLLPSEPVQVVQLSPASAGAKEIWAGCWPDFPAAKKTDLSKQNPFFGKPPLKILETQQSVFRGNVGTALSRIFEAGRRPRNEIAAARPTARKELVASIMADESRFRRGKSGLRVIFYSDMAENSDYLTPAGDGDAERAGREAAEKLKLDVGGASIYAFGVESGSGERAQSEKARAFWTAFFKQAGGYLNGFGTELNIPGSPAVQAVTYDVEVQVQGASKFGQLRLLADDKGQLQDSSLFFSPRANAAIEGSLVCRGSERCLLEARTLAGTITLWAREEMRLEGSARRSSAARSGFPTA